MSNLGKSISKFFKPKVEREKKRKAAESADLPEWIMDMEEGSDKTRAIAAHRANQKKDKKKDKYECGGVKYSKLKERMKGKKD